MNGLRGPSSGDDDNPPIGNVRPASILIIGYLNLNMKLYMYMYVVLRFITCSLEAPITSARGGGLVILYAKDACRPSLICKSIEIKKLIKIG
jgi:hypothetical protein